jgi:hypothetical protein
MSESKVAKAKKLERSARKQKRLKTKRVSAEKASKLIVRSEEPKRILRYYGSGIRRGNIKHMRWNRPDSR